MPGSAALIPIAGQRTMKKRIHSHLFKMYRQLRVLMHQRHSHHVSLRLIKILSCQSRSLYSILKAIRKKRHDLMHAVKNLHTSPDSSGSRDSVIGPSQKSRLKSHPFSVNFYHVLHVLRADLRHARKNYPVPLRSEVSGVAYCILFGYVA